MLDKDKIIEDFLHKCKLEGYELVHIPTILEELGKLSKRIDEVLSYDYRNLGQTPACEPSSH